MQKPRALRPGDRVAAVAPASPFDRHEFEAGADELRRLGFDVAIDERVFLRTGYLSGSAEARAASFLAAWEAPDIAGVIGIRGGYGSAHILPRLDPSVLRRHPKVFVGYSDLTSLLIHLGDACDLVTFHGPMLAGKLGRGEAGYDRESFLRCLTRTEPIGELGAGAMQVVEPGEAAGVVLGGTLSQIVASLGTPYAFRPPEGYILFLDEVRERPYRLDRMLTQLRFAGLLDRAAGIVVGELPGCDEPSGSPSARETVGRLLAGRGRPVVLGFPSGHTSGPSVTLPLGVRGRLVTAPSPRLVIEESAVT